MEHANHILTIAKTNQPLGEVVCILTVLSFADASLSSPAILKAMPLIIMSIMLILLTVAVISVMAFQQPVDRGATDREHRVQHHEQLQE